MLSTKITKEKPTVFNHPDFGKLPSKVVLECVFVLLPSGDIAHHHQEEVDIDETEQEIVFSVNGHDPDTNRSRCQIIPPRIPEFPKLA